jgi:hypothetical protein
MNSTQDDAVADDPQDRIRFALQPMEELRIETEDTKGIIIQVGHKILHVHSIHHSLAHAIAQ